MGSGSAPGRECSSRSGDGHASGSINIDRFRNTPQPKHNGNGAQHTEANDTPNDNQDDFDSSAGWRGGIRRLPDGNLPSGSRSRVASWRAATLAKPRVRRQLSPALRTKTNHGSSSRN